MWGATMFDQLMCRVMFHSLDYKGPYTPPSENGTIVFPGNLGMFEWGGISVNPDRQVAVMNPWHYHSYLNSFHVVRVIRSGLKVE